MLGQNIEMDTTNIPEAKIFYQPGRGGSIQKIQLDSQVFVSSTLGDLLEKNTSVFVNSNGVSGLQSVSIRGTGSNHTAVYWNGLSIQSPTLGMVDFSTLSPSTIDQIEIHLGASSLVDGSGGLGGSIQFTDRLVFDTLLQASLQTGFGSFGKSYRNLKFNWANAKWSTLLAVGDVDAPNVFAFANPTKPNNSIDTLKNAGVKSFSAKLGLGYRWNESVHFDAFVWHNSSSRGLPKSITANDFGEDFQKDNSWRSVVNLTVSKKRLLHQFSLGNIQDVLDYHADILSVVKTQSFHVNYRQTAYLNEFFKVKTALEFSKNSAVSDGFGQGVSQNKIGLMINPQWKWKDKVTADFILRVENYDSKFVPVMPSLLVNYFVSKTVNIRATASRIYRQPTFNDLYWNLWGNPNLNPENGTSFELGVDFLTTSKNAEVNVTAFHSEINDWIIWLPIDGINYTPQNLYLVKSQGIEVGLKYQKRLTKKIALKTSVNYSLVLSRNYHATIDNDLGVGKQLPYVPKNKVNAGVNLSINKQWQLGYQYRFTDKRFIAQDHSSWMPYFMISDATLRYYFRQMRWVDYVGINVNNILNKNYEVLPYRPMMQRNVMVNLKFSFEK